MWMVSSEDCNQSESTNRSVNQVESVVPVHGGHLSKIDMQDYASASCDFTQEEVCKATMYISELEDCKSECRYLQPQWEELVEASSHGKSSPIEGDGKSQKDPPAKRKGRGRPHGPPSPHSCGNCSMTFTHLAHLRIHERTHTGEKPYDCSECGKRFAQIAHLKVHERIHTGEKPYNCSVCGKRFSQLASLQVHERRHTGEKPFQCDKCQASFSQLANLLAHKTKHIGGVPYPCTHCGKIFSTAGTLKVHERVHTGDKPFQCGYCFKSFTQLGNLKAHIERHKRKGDSLAQAD